MNQEVYKPFHISDQPMIKLQFLLRISKPRNTEYVLTHLQKRIYLKIWINEKCVRSVNNLLEAERLFKTPYLKPKQSLLRSRTHDLEQKLLMTNDKAKENVEERRRQHCSVF